MERYFQPPFILASEEGLLYRLSPPFMRFCLKFLLILLLSATFCRGQVDSAGSFGESPVEVESDGGTRFEGGIAIAEENVTIRYRDTLIYADYAQYDPDTREVFVKGNVRIYRESRVFSGDRAVYNLETKLLRAANFKSGAYPIYFQGDNLTSHGTREITIRNGIFTTSDSSKPDYFLRSRGVRIYPDDRVIFTRTTLYIGNTPVFWWPYLYQSLKKELGFSFTPGYNTRLGGFLLTESAFPIAENVTGQLRLDLMTERGVGVGIGSDWATGKGNRNKGKFRAYYVDDQRPNDNPTGESRPPTDSGRYRVELKTRLFFTDEIYANVKGDLLSDENFLEDFDPGQFRVDPQPDNMVSLTKYHRNFTLSLITRGQLNEFFDTTERLPELVLDMKRQQIFRTPLFYEGETGAAYLRRSFASGEPEEDYESFRADTFHQITLPGTYFGWLSVIPRVGYRGTYYSRSIASLEDLTGDMIDSTSGILEPLPVSINDDGDAVFRSTINAGIESSFKLSRVYEKAQSRLLGLEGLLHVVQPYTNFSYAYNTHGENDILPFDRLIPSSQLPPIDFPQFNSIDTIPNWTIWRFGMHNRFLTRRNNDTQPWLEIDTFFDWYLDNPNFGGAFAEDASFSNVYNRLRWTPLPWASLELDSQLPVFDDGFTEVNTRLNFLVNRNVSLQIDHRYINGNPFFEDSSLLGIGGYLRLGENWGFSFRDRYEFNDNILQEQRYQIHRDLSSWVASFGFVMRDNSGGKDEYGILLSFTLKDLPSVNLPFDFDPQSQLGSNE
jgi:LPS-assembly protein